MPIIGFHGRSGSGKDTAYKAIQKLDPTAERRAFADPMKEILARAFSVPVSVIEDMKRESLGIYLNAKDTMYRTTMRKVIQRFGTEAMRDIFSEDIWLDLVLPFGDEAYSNRVIVVTDVRLEREANRIHEFGGVVWEINRPVWTMNDEINLLHTTEAGISAECIDRVIFNEGSIDDLHSKITDAYAEEFVK